MLLDLTTVPTDSERLERTYEPSLFAADDTDFVVTAPVELAFDISQKDAEFRLVGRVRTVLELACSRCLDRLSLPVDGAFDLLYVAQSANAGEGEREVEPDDLTTAYYRDDVIDLGLLMREQFYLALPMKPLCQDACRGLCPSCGLNLNAASCDCDTTWHDPRLAGLKALLKNGPTD